MQKLPQEIREKALAEAREILITRGYKALTMREIAGRCGVAVGSLYNLFSSKEYLAGCVVLRDWIGARREMERSAQSAAEPLEGLRRIYELMAAFSEAHAYLTDVGVPRPREGEYSYARQHGLLVSQIRAVLRALPAWPVQEDEEVFLAESIIGFAGKGYPWERLESSFARLIRREREE
ncbi:MAG: TetR/AcrR family transcriptional regulator [Oscillospiraceae bacterium]|nr:TetR/AcrR family transcriptional regulator [Oscillospiraceae bacterium]